MATKAAIKRRGRPRARPCRNLIAKYKTTDGKLNDWQLDGKLPAFLGVSRLLMTYLIL